MEISVKLTTEEIKLGEKLGTERYNTSRKMGLKNRCSNIQQDIDGMKGEISGAKGLRIPFKGNLNTFKSPDLPGTNIQIRCTKWKNGRLYIGKNDNPSHRYLLVRGEGADYRLIGWISGSGAFAEAIEEEHNGKKISFVPTEKLLPPELLVAKYDFTVHINMKGN